MGQVYLARATGLGGFERKVVIKVLDPYVTDDEDFVAMFLDEARLVGSLHHHCIAPVYEVDRDPAGHLFLVMDYIRGETAEAIWKASEARDRPIPLALSLTVGSAVASALGYAHDLRGTDGAPLDIVHRDVSLSNVMVGYDGSVKLIDFGIAKAANRASRTHAGALKGKLGYLAPEQMLHKAIDRRTDLFALGIVLYELTTTHRAFGDSSDLDTFERIARAEIPAPSSVVPGYPAELEAIVMRALAAEPDARYQDAASFGRALETFAATSNIALGPAPVVDAMGTLFGGPIHRRRFARGSETPTAPHEKIAPEDLASDSGPELVAARLTPPDARITPADLPPSGMPRSRTVRGDDTEVMPPKNRAEREERITVPMMEAVVVEEAPEEVSVRFRSSDMLAAERPRSERIASESEPTHWRIGRLIALGLVLLALAILLGYLLAG
jgi:eukaryotic-like serine/threonine-protein kinase